MTSTTFPLSLLAALLIGAGTGSQAAFLVEEGKPRAQIVIAEDCSRTTRLAALELQSTLAKISGAELPVVHAPSDGYPTNIFVGQNRWTEELGITNAGLEHGAYRIATGPDWMVLTGDDTEFQPIDPWPRNNQEWASGKVQKEWEQITGAIWGNPMAGLYKNASGRSVFAGSSSAAGSDPNQPVNVWSFDGRGSFNAVVGFLHSLGARWYLPGELGEVLPQLPTIPLPSINETVHPDFAVRQINFRYAVAGPVTSRWAMRLGLRDDPSVQLAHGMATMTGRREVMEAHPDWFALYRGRRHTDPEIKNNQLCYSNPELFEQTVRYARALFDHYDLRVVSVMPPDGYTAICECELCTGKDTPERPDRGRLSDYVWDFVNRVARETAKTHPDRMISSCAYGVYTLPPENIEQLEPNVLVCIVGGRRPMSNKPEQQEATAALRAEWADKTDNPIMVFENYPFTDRGMYLPAFAPHSIGTSINATKGSSAGEDIWLTTGHHFDTRDIGFNHFMVYFTARMWWGGGQADVAELFDEYCRLFYGPAADSMRKFFLYCEENWQEMEGDKATADRALGLFDAALAEVETESIYGRRLALIGAYLQGLRNRSEQLGRTRGPVPVLRLARDARGIAIDGGLDDPFWTNILSHATGGLRESETGALPAFATDFKAAWGADGNLYLAIRCEDQTGEAPHSSGERHGDPAILEGDAIHVLLETNSNSYYHIAVNPEGLILDMDWSAPEAMRANWSALAEVATATGDGFWTVEMKIPVTTDENDPLHRVIGRKPTGSLPWHFNVARQRVRANGSEMSAFSPTATGSLHEPQRFAVLYEGRSRQFERDPAYEDFLIQRRRAGSLQDRREAIDALVALAGDDRTPRQQSDALAQAARLARDGKDHALADEIAAGIPVPAVAQTVRMENVLARGQPELVVDEFGAEEIAAWPFWQAAAGYAARARALAATGNGQRAEQDFQQAIRLERDRLARANLLRAAGANRKSNLDDNEGALAAWLEVARMQGIGGSATYLGTIQQAAGLLSQLGRHDQAIEVLGHADVESLAGHWRNVLLLEFAATHRAAGNARAARDACKQVLADENASASQHAAAEKILSQIH